MFTFTGSGTDLLTRTLALVSSREDARRRVLAEVAAAGPPDRAETIERLPFLNACLLETGRLFPPVTRTFHGGAPNGGARDAAHEAAGGGRGPEYVHWFPLLQRDDALGPDVHAFRPERWLTPEPDAAAAASNLFLRGPRACPGADLILFVCRAALARQLAELGVAARSERLARDPLPVAFPGREARFTSSEALR
jgi:cytochrome P450